MKAYYDEKRVSNSSLTWFQHSPKYFKLMLDGEIKEPSRTYFEYGQQVHMYILEPDEFDKEYIFLDYTTPKSAQQKLFCEKYSAYKKGLKTEKLVRAYKEAYTTKETDDKILDKAKKLEKDFTEYIKFIKQRHLYTKILSSSTLYKLNESKESVLNHKRAIELTFNEDHTTFGNSDKLFIQNEFQINWEWSKKEYDNIPCKSLIDRLVINHEKKVIQLVDLKTTSNLSDFTSAFKDYKYYRQLAFYWMAIHWYFKHDLKLNIEDYKKETYIVAISSREPIETIVFKILDRQLNTGLEEIDNIMHDLEWHWTNDKWDYARLYYEGEGIKLI